MDANIAQQSLRKTANYCFNIVAGFTPETWNLDQVTVMALLSTREKLRNSRRISALAGFQVSSELGGIAIALIFSCYTADYSLYGRFWGRKTGAEVRCLLV